jgi:hypothetical protein
MKFLSIFALFVVLMISSCTERAPKPKPLLSEKKMVELLTEIHLTEAALQQMQSQRYNLDSSRLYTNVAYSELFEKYGLTRESFEANVYYRTYHSRDIEKIFVRVQDILQQMDEQNRVEKLELQERAINIEN